jgi:polysaccharide pyruvyl transferase CsaB
VKKHLTITGYYGFGNAGDDAILEALSARLVGLGFGLTVITYPDADTARLSATLGIEAIDGRDLQAAARAIEQSDALLIGGGGLIQDYLPSDPDTHLTPRHGNLSFWTTMALLARSSGVPAIGYALGVGPLSTPEGRDHARMFFELLSLTIVRDEPSAALVEGLGLARPEVAADPAYLLEPATRDPLEGGLDDLPTGGALRICVSVRSWPGNDAWQSELAAALDLLIERHDADILFLPFQQSRKGLDNDALVATRIAARMKHTARRAVISTELTPAEKAAVIAGSDLVIGMRLHSLVFAATAETPAVGIAYDPKVLNAMADLGLADLAVDLSEVHAQDLVERAERALSRADKETGPVATMKDRAARAEQLLTAFLASPTLPPVGDEAAAILSRAAVKNAGDLLNAERDRDDWHLRAVELADELEKSQTAYDKLAAQFQNFMDARSVRTVRSLWSLRDKVKALPATAASLARRVAKQVLPGRARKALRAAVGSKPAGPESPEWTAEELVRFTAEIEADLAQIVATHRDAPGFVVFPPGIGWDVELFQRPQQMALAFSRLGYPVLYHLEEKYRDGLVGYERYNELIYTGYLPEPLLDLLLVVPSPIFPAYVYNFDWQEHLSDPISVYEHIDDLEVFEHVYRRDDLRAWHRHALEDATVVAASAVDLLSDVSTNRPDAVLVANGVDLDHFSGGDLPMPDDLSAVLSGKPVIGYYGALAEWFDYDLLESAARALDYDFVLIGPDYDGTAADSPALALPNVHWLGPRPYATLPAYLGRFDVATIPFLVNDVTHAVSPIKLFEYMAAGKPVVTPPLRECARYRSVQIGEGLDGYVAELQRAVELANDPDHVALLRRTARSNTWKVRVRTLLEAVEQARLKEPDRG